MTWQSAWYVGTGGGAGVNIFGDAISIELAGSVGVVVDGRDVSIDVAGTRQTVDVTGPTISVSMPSPIVVDVCSC